MYIILHKSTLFKQNITFDSFSSRGRKKKPKTANNLSPRKHKPLLQTSTWKSR